MGSGASKCNIITLIRSINIIFVVKKNFALRVLAIKDGQYVFFFVATRVTNYLRKWRVYSKYPSDIILVTNLY